MVRELIRTKDFLRILNLPRRTWDEQDTSLAKRCTEVLKTPHGSMELFPVQAQALVECASYRGLFAPIQVGGGKTLITLLAPTALSARRPLLLLPAKLVEKTKRAWRELSVHWNITRHLRILSYEALSRIGQDSYLENTLPDLIMCDEAHKVRNKKAAVTRRLMRYLNNHPDTVFVVLSGTMTKRSLMDYHHLITRTHHLMSPMPLAVKEAEEWSNAIDNRVIIDRWRPGPLLDLGGEGDTHLEQARTGYCKRLVETPGVITMGDARLPTALSYTTRRVTPSKKVQSALATLKDTWETPDGWPLSDPMAVWRHARELLLGFYYVWNPRPPRPWVDARRAWGKFVRETLKHSKQLDSELMVKRAFPLQPELQAWREIEKSFTPNSVATWLCDYAVDEVAKWMSESSTLVWIEHMAFGERLSHLTKVPFFRGGMSGLELLDGRTTLVGILAQGEGQNLQAWNRNIITSMPPNGTIMEQLVGRTHRTGQTADEVTVEILVSDTLHAEAIEKAISDAQYIEQSTKQRQKILYGDWT